MKITNAAVRQIKQLYKQIFFNRTDPTKEAKVKQARSEIKFNFNLYGIENEEDFAKEHSFCIDCGCGLTDDNDCPGCGRQFGW